MFKRILLIGALAALSAGCSLVLVDGPPDFLPANDPVPPGSCTVDRTIPLIDAVGAAGGLVTALTNSDGDAVRIGAVVGAALGFSSYRGFSRVGRCRERMTIAPDSASVGQAPFSPFKASAVTIPREQIDGWPRVPGIEAPPLPVVPATAPYRRLRIPESAAAPTPLQARRTGG